MREVGCERGVRGALPPRQQMLPINFPVTSSQRDWKTLGVAGGGWG